MLSVNLAGFFHVSQRAVRQMLTQRAGHIVNLTTTLVASPSRACRGIGVSDQGGLDAVTRSLAIEYADHGIRVNAVAPGVIKTPMHPPETHAFLAGLHPMGRMGEVQRLSRPCCTWRRPRSSPAKRCTSTAGHMPATGNPRPRSASSEFRRCIRGSSQVYAFGHFARDSARRRGPVGPLHSPTRLTAGSRTKLQC